ncbi:MAG: serine hydrolase, partial [Kofleriaceae bacterium]
MPTLMRRLFLHSLWVGPAAMFGMLWLYAGCDVRYMMRVLVRQESNTDDYQWKRSMPVAPSTTPARWPETRDCDAVGAAFAPEADGPELASYLTRGGALAFVVVRDGAIACEWYGNGGARDRPAAAFSISKSVTSLILARAVAGGTIHRLDEPITERVPELAARDPRFSAITLAALVDMRSGIAFDDT